MRSLATILGGTASSSFEEQRQLFAGQPQRGHTRPAPVE
jgi:hypothetical protein